MDALQALPLTINPTTAGCVAGSTNTWSNSVATAHVIGGKFGTPLAINSAQSIVPTLDANTGLAFPTILKNQAAAVVFGVNAAGSLVAAQGPITPTEIGVTTTVGAFLAAPQFPALPDDFCPIAYTLVRVAPSGAGFTLGVSNWTGTPAYATCTTFKNICTMPARPQIS